MKRFIKSTFIILLACATLPACKKDYPVDGDGLLITSRQECYVSSFDLLGSDFVSVLPSGKLAVIDTTAQTINIQVSFGTDLKNLFPQFTLATDCKLNPKITGKEDFSDLANPKQYTVISGNRQIEKTYKVIVTVQPR